MCAGDAGSGGTWRALSCGGQQWLSRKQRGSALVTAGTSVCVAQLRCGCVGWYDSSLSMSLYSCCVRTEKDAFLSASSAFFALWLRMYIAGGRFFGRRSYYRGLKHSAALVSCYLLSPAARHFSLLRSWMERWTVERRAFSLRYSSYPYLSISVWSGGGRPSPVACLPRCCRAAPCMPGFVPSACRRAGLLLLPCISCLPPAHFSASSGRKPVLFLGGMPPTCLNLHYEGLHLLSCLAYLSLRQELSSPSACTGPGRTGSHSPLLRCAGSIRFLSSGCRPPVSASRPPLPALKCCMLSFSAAVLLPAYALSVCSGKELPGRAGRRHGRTFHHIAVCRLLCCMRVLLLLYASWTLYMYMQSRTDYSTGVAEGRACAALPRGQASSEGRRQALLRGRGGATWGICHTTPPHTHGWTAVVLRTIRF